MAPTLTDRPDPPKRPSFAASVLGLFTNVKFGIVLMVLLFLYMSLGSAGAVYPVAWNVFSSENWRHEQIRQWPIFEMTEFEWFHWWPFDVLVTLIAITMISTTLRRIRFSVVNLGVWMIHSGIITLIVGSLIYFGTKVEGDTPVHRRALVLQVIDSDGAALSAPVRMSIFPGNMAQVRGGEKLYRVQVRSADPSWELLSGDDAGVRAYSVTVQVDGGPRSFMRQVIANYPQYTEDLVESDDPQQPFQRAVKLTGNPIIDPSLRVTLAYEPQSWFYLSNQLSKNWALYLREEGSTQWVERPIPAARPLDPSKKGLPLYGDYLADPTLLARGSAQANAEPNPLDVHVPAVAANDPMHGIDFRLDSYIRYGALQTVYEQGEHSAPFNPLIDLHIDAEGHSGANHRLLALDPQRNSEADGLIAFRTVDSEEAFNAMTQPPKLHVRIPSAGIDVTRGLVELAESPTWPILGTDYTLIFSGIEENIPLADGSVSVVFVDVRSAEKSFRRWAFGDAKLARDMNNGEGPDLNAPERLFDDAIEITYEAGRGTAVFLAIAGPGEDTLRAVDTIRPNAPKIMDLTPGETYRLAAQLSVRVDNFLSRAVERRAPIVIPRAQRQAGDANFYAMVRMQLPSGDTQWLPFHLYPSPSFSQRLGRWNYPYAPSTLRMQSMDGSWKTIELVFSRKRMKLPSPVVLETFELDTHLGGYSGQGTSVRDYRSSVRFEDGGTWGKAQSVSLNKPAEHDGLWFFQAQWDPPEGQSLGLNYTVLGVGNRNGVRVQLAGCIIAVTGMLYAFYVKPLIKRRRRDRVLAGLGSHDETKGQVQ